MAKKKRRPPYRYSVYVIALEPGVLSDPEFRRRNPRMREDGRCYYVGQTAHDPECRFLQHVSHPERGQPFVCRCYLRLGRLEKVHACRLAKRHGLRLCRELFEEYNPLKTRKKAMEMEEALAKNLQVRGHGVWWGEEQLQAGWPELEEP